MHIIIKYIQIIIMKIYPYECFLFSGYPKNKQYKYPPPLRYLEVSIQGGFTVYFECIQNYFSYLKFKFSEIFINYFKVVKRILHRYMMMIYFYL